MAHSQEHLDKFVIPGRVELAVGEGGLAKVRLTSKAASAEMYLHGAHVTDFRLNGQPPLLFLSRSSLFEPNRAIRGGIPIVLPWFGPRAGEVAHGFARLMDWELEATAATPEGDSMVRLRLPAVPAPWPPFTALFQVTISDRFCAELTITNRSPDRRLQFENCLHTYFQVGDIAQVAIAGLGDEPYRDELDGTMKSEPGQSFGIGAEVDRTYFDTTTTAEILDASLGRRIRVEKEHSRSTVVWNPWIAKAKRMADFGDEEYREMVCVESGNIGPNRIDLAPGETSQLRICLSSLPL